MEIPRRDLQRNPNGLSHPAKETSRVHTSEESDGLHEESEETYTSLSSVGNGVAANTPIDSWADLPGADGIAQVATEPTPELGDGASTLSREETTSTAAPKKTQSVEHISWMTRRVDTLEEELRRLRMEAYQRGSVEQQLEREAAASHEEFDREQSLENRNIRLDEFRGIKDKYEVTKGNVILCAKAERREVSVQISAETETMVPYRLAINSYCVLDLLAMFHKTAKLYNVHLRPFKFLVCYQKELKQKLHQLQTQCKEIQSSKNHTEHSLSQQTADRPGERDMSGAGPGDTPDSADDKPAEIDGAELDKKQRLRDHLGSLVNFIDNEMEEIFQRRKILDEAGQDEILFEDLYHLFRPGQLVYTNPGQDPASRRAYRVLHVTGGRSIRDIAGNLGVDKDGSEPGGKLEEDLFRFSPESAGQTQQRVPGTTFKMSPVLIDCVYTDYDGEYYTPKSLRFVMLEYEGTKPIRHLDIYPEHYDKDPNETKRLLMERGKRFVASALAQHKTYTGRPLADSKNVFVPEINGEVILDHGQKMNSREQASSGDEFLEEPSKWDRREAFKSTALDPAALGTDLWWDYEVDEQLRKGFLESEVGREVLETDHTPTQEQLILLPVRIWGYVLTERKWHQLNINNIRDVQRKSNVDDGAIRSFNDLVLRPQHKKLIQALVTNQMWLQSANLSDADTNASQVRSEQVSGQSLSLDIVRGKGRGLIILLHGVPGVGKTSTAECVAAQLGRPLFPITCGDLGTDAEGVERKLDTFFFLAQKWKCVLLLDEADVFLTRRSTGDFVRNGIVSVFLRVLETFTGVLILTTNRVGEFDEAFRSRIHVSILYPRLDEDSTVEIYDVNLRRIKENQSLDVDVDEEAIREFGKEHFRSNRDSPSRRWTGRQIKNAFQTAIALANWDFYDQGEGSSSGQNARPTLKAKHFEYIARTSADFDEYLDRVHQSSGPGWGPELAADHHLRNDEFDSNTLVPERRRSRRESASLFSVDSMNPLSPIVSKGDDETKIKKLQLKLKNLHKLNLSPAEENQMRLDLYSELDELGVEDDTGMINGHGGSSRREERTPWA